MDLKKKASMTVIGIALIAQVACAAIGNETLPVRSYDGIPFVHVGEFSPNCQNISARDNTSHISSQNIPDAAEEIAIFHSHHLGRALLQKGNFTPPSPNPEAPAAKYTTVDSSDQNVPQPPPRYPEPTNSSEKPKN